MRICDIASSDRPRERLRFNGPSVLSNQELLAILLRTGTRKSKKIASENVIDMSNRLIAEYGLDKLNSLSLNELMKIRGIGLAKASTIQAAFELNKRINAGKLPSKKVKSASDIAHYYREKMKDLKKEHLIAVFLDSRNKIIKDEVISIGTLDSSLVHPREVFKEAIKNSASSLILVHNHPSGDPNPSEEDKHVMDVFLEAGKLLNIKVIDHVIIGNNRWWSWMEE